MKKIQSPLVNELLADLRFSPRKQKIIQLESAEKLFHIVQPDRDYPYEFVCYFITSYRPKEKANEMIKGKVLKRDLQLFIRNLSSGINQKIDEVNEQVYTLEDVSERFRVSTRTVERWRSKGLLAKKYLFENGKKKTGFTERNLETFVENYPELIKKAEKFTLVPDEIKERIIKRAKEIVNSNHTPRNQTIVALSKEFGRSRDTIRRILVDYENANDTKPIFSRPSGVIYTKDQKEIYKAFTEGIEVDELAKKYNRSKSSIYRIVNKRRLIELRKKKVDFIDNEEFYLPDAEEKIIGDSHELANVLDLPHDEIFDPEFLPKYINIIKDIAPLTRKQEAELFRQYNYLKMKAKRIIDSLASKDHVKSSELKAVEDYLEQKELIRRTLIVSNLRLVVSIANRHSGWGTMLSDLISDGNMSLMRAVEKFDYSRGFRFSTYASWAIAKDFARRIPAEANRPDKATAVDIEDIQKDLRQRNLTGVAEIEQAHESLEYKILNNLSEREQYIIKNHYGLIKTGMKKKYKSLKQIGEEIGLSKERVRQLELIALQKLRQSMGPEEFELLTK